MSVVNKLLRRQIVMALFSCFKKKHRYRRGTSFERLSNELIYECFDYLSYCDIQLAFKKLNQRFQNLIDNYPFSINLHRHFQHHVEHIATMKSFHSLWIGAQYQANRLDFSQIRFIKALAFENIPADRCLKILQEIPNNCLQHIYIGSLPFSSFSEQHNKDSVELQTKIFQLAAFYLRSCQIRASLNVDISRIPIELISLKILKLDNFKDEAQVRQLIQRMPNLKICLLKRFQSGI